jgi:hypothetical protein
MILTPDFHLFGARQHFFGDHHTTFCYLGFHDYDLLCAFVFFKTLQKSSAAKGLELAGISEVWNGAH